MLHRGSKCYWLMYQLRGGEWVSTLEEWTSTLHHSVPEGDGCKVGNKHKAHHFLTLYKEGSPVIHSGAITNKNTSVKKQSIWSWQSVLQQSIEITTVEKVLNKMKNHIINDSRRFWRGKKWCSKTNPYCLHSKEPELVAFPVGSLSWKGKDSINIVTELPFNVSEMVTEHKGTLKEVSRGCKCFHCLCGISSLNKGIQSHSLQPASFINFGEWLNTMFLNLKWKKTWKCTLVLLPADTFRHCGPNFQCLYVLLPTVSFFLLRPATLHIPKSSFRAVFRLS